MPKKDSSSEMPSEPIQLLKPNFREAVVEVEGTSELIVHRFSDKAKRMMLEAQMSKTRRAREARDPEKEYVEAQYLLPDGHQGFPAAGFKVATVDACRNFQGLPMTTARVILRFIGEGRDQLVPIEGEPYMREDTVRLETGVADLRYRPGFWPWSAKLQVRWNADVLSLESLGNLIEAGGEGGVGEWRPNSKKSKSGTYGCYRLVSITELVKKGTKK